MNISSNYIIILLIEYSFIHVLNVHIHEADLSGDKEGVAV